MPKGSIEVKKFQTGIVTNFDQKDIPIDAASHSWNVDPMSEAGSLSGIETDLQGPDSIGLAYQSEVIIKDGSRTLIGYYPKLYTNVTASASIFRGIVNYDKSTAASVNLSNTIENNPIHACTMESNNSEVHIGIGNAATKWAGYVDYKQFGEDYGLIMEDAELKKPTNFDDMYKVVNIGDYIYGIKWRGQYLYRFHKTTKVILKSRKRFEYLQGLALVSLDTNNLWLFDAGAGSKGNLIKYHTNLVSEPSIQLSLSADDDYKVNEISDIIQTDKIWYIRPVDKLPKDELNDGENAWIWNHAVPTDSSAKTLASKTPLFKNAENQTTTNGQWYGLEDGMFYSHGTTYTSSNHDNRASTGGDFTFSVNAAADTGYYTVGNNPSYIDSMSLVKEFGSNLITDVDKNSKINESTTDWAAYKTDSTGTVGVTLAVEDELQRLKITHDGGGTGMMGVELAAANFTDFDIDGSHAGTNGYHNMYKVSFNVYNDSSDPVETAAYLQVRMGGSLQYATVENTETLSTSHVISEIVHGDAHTLTTDPVRVHSYISATTTSGYGDKIIIALEVAASTGSFYLEDIVVEKCRTLMAEGQKGGFNYSTDTADNVTTNGLPTEDFLYDEDLDTYFEVCTDVRKHATYAWNNAITAPDMKVCSWKVNNNANDVNFGKLNLTGIYEIAAGKTGGDDTDTWGGGNTGTNNYVGNSGSQAVHTASCCIDPVNKIIFSSASTRVYSQGYGDGYVNPRGSTLHDNGLDYLNAGKHVFDMVCDPNNRKLILTMRDSTPVIYNYSKEGVIHTQTGDWTSVSGLPSEDYNGLAIDINNNFFFVTNKKSGGTVSSLYYTPTEENFKPEAGVITSSLPIIKDDLNTSVISGGKIALDTDRKLLFARVPFQEREDIIINSFSYDQDGNLSYVHKLKGSSTHLDLASSRGETTSPSSYPDYQFHTYTRISSTTKEGDDWCYKIKTDTDSNLVFMHTGSSIISIPYNNDGTFPADSLDGISNAETRVISSPHITVDTGLYANQYSGFVTGGRRGLGTGFGIVKAKGNFGENSGLGLLLIGSHQGVTSTKGYANNSSYVNIPKVPLLKPRDNNGALEAGIVFPMVVNNSLGDGTGSNGPKSGNHIYYYNDSTKIKSQLFWIYITDSLNPAQTNGTETLNGTVGDAFLGTTNVNTAFEGKIHSVAFSQENKATGVLAAESEGASGSSVTLTVDTVDATTGLFLNKKVYKSDGTLFGVCTAVNSTTEIVFAGGLLSAIANNDNLYVASNKKIALTASDAYKNDTFRIHTKNTNSAVDWINIQTASNTAQVMTKSSDEISLKNASITTYESSSSALTDNDDQTFDVFEGDPAGTGKWARLHYDQTGENFASEFAYAPTNAHGIITLTDGTTAIATQLTALANTNGFTILDSAGNSRMYIFDNSGSPATGSLDGSSRCIIQTNGLSTRVQVATQIAAAINNSNGHGSSGHDTITVSQGIFGMLEHKIFLTHDALGTAGNINITEGALPVGNYISIVGFSGAVDFEEISTRAIGLLTSPLDSNFELITKDLDSDKGGTGVKKNNKYFYKLSFMYDGYQEGPLSDEFTYIAEEDGNLKIKLKLHSTDSIPKRCSHVNVYRSETSDVKATKPQGYYRLSKSIRLDNEWKKVTETEEVNPDYGVFKEYEYIDEGDLFGSFESRAGYSSVLDDMSIRYSLSTQLNNTHFIGDVFHPVLDSEGGNFIVKSLPYKFDTFDYTKDILRLKTNITALEAFAGRLWAFSESKIYKIEPNGFYVEEEMKGMGCLHNKSITITPYGMFWCDAKNMYWHNGKSITAIGDTVKKGGQYSWQTHGKFDDMGETGTCNTGGFTTEAECVAAGNTWTANNEVDVDITTAPQPPVVVYDGNKQSVHFIFQYYNLADGSDGKNAARFSWVYNIPMQKWDLLEMRDGTGSSTLGKVLNAFTNEDGDAVYIINPSQIEVLPYVYTINKGASKRAYTWHSKEITLENDSQYKNFVYIDIAGVTADLSSYLTIEIDGTSVAKTFEAYEAGGRYKIKYGFRKGKALKIKLDEVPGTNIIDSIGIIYRMKSPR